MYTVRWRVISIVSECNETRFGVNPNPDFIIEYALNDTRRWVTCVGCRYVARCRQPAVRTVQVSLRRGVGFGEGCPPPNRVRVWEGGCASPQNFFRCLSSKRRVLVHSGTDKTYFWSAWCLDVLASSRLGAGAIAPSALPWIRVVRE